MKSFSLLLMGILLFNFNNSWANTSAAAICSQVTQNKLPSPQLFSNTLWTDSSNLASTAQIRIDDQGRGFIKDPGHPIFPNKQIGGNQIIIKHDSFSGFNNGKKSSYLLIPYNLTGAAYFGIKCENGNAYLCNNYCLKLQ